MTLQEFSDEFDVHYNNIMSNQAPGLDEYEKSVFLTKAQDEIVKDYFNPKLNKVQEGFDQNQRRQIDFSMLIKTAKGSPVDDDVTNLFPLEHTAVYAIPDRIMMFINESLEVKRNSKKKYLTVVPLDYAEYARLMSKPFKRPLKNQAWRLITNTITTVKTTDYDKIDSLLVDFTGMNSGDFITSYNTMCKSLNVDSLELTFTKVSDDVYNLNIGDKGSLQVNGKAAELTEDEVEEISSYINMSTNKAVVELIPGPVDSITSYTIRYVARPRAIILAELEGVTLDGTDQPQECELDEILHQEILQRAVELAKAAYSGTLGDSVSLGINSQTPIGMVSSGGKQ
jgi:hypothetical protein